MPLVGALLVQKGAAFRDDPRGFDPDALLNVFKVARRALLTAGGRVRPPHSRASDLRGGPRGRGGLDRGGVEITLHYACVDDVGQPINPLIFEARSTAAPCMASARRLANARCSSRPA